MRSLLRKFLRFRWKLLFAATLATVATTVVVMMVYITLFRVSQRSHLSSDHFPDEVLGEVEVIARQVGQLVQREPPDTESLEAWIESYARTGKFELRLVPGVCDERGQWESALHVARFAIVNEQGEFLAGRPEGTMVLGQSLAPDLPPLGLAVFEAAARGSSDRSQLAQRLDLGNSFAALPIHDSDGNVQGVVYVEAETEPPTPAEIFLMVVNEIPQGLIEILPFCIILGVVFSLVTSWGLLRRLRQLGVAAAAWSRGDFSFRVRDTSGDELGELGRNLDDMADQLGGLLETKQALAGLEERNHLARELHDTVKQELFSVSMLLGTVEELTGKDDTAAAKHLAEARRLAQKAGRELNALILQLRPAALDGKGLAGALREYCEAWSKQIGIASQVRVQGERALPLEVEQGLFRVAQEALANVAWHSGSESVDVHLAIGPALHATESGSTKGAGLGQGSLMLTIRDHGRGFDTARAGSNGGYGLSSMRERVEHLSGQLRIESRPGNGTTVVAECPLPEVRGQN